MLNIKHILCLKFSLLFFCLKIEFIDPVYYFMLYIFDGYIFLSYNNLANMLEI